MIAGRDRAAEEATAARYRDEAAMFRAEATEAAEAGDVGRAVDLNRSAGDLTVLAASIERDIRGLPPLPPASLGGEAPPAP